MMKKSWLFAVFIALSCRAAFPQVPETGRWQELAFSTEDVNAHTEDRYRDMLARLSAKTALDDDQAILARVRRVGATLIQAAIALKPQAAHWQWEIHTTSDADVDAFCMAGGKLLIGSRFVRNLQLNDGELATLIGHEVAHAVAEHHREALSEALLINPHPSLTLEVVMLRLDADWSLQIHLAELSNLQETEADQLGMTLAHNAGWSAADMIGFYRKLAATDADAVSSASVLNSSHPSGAARVSMARGLALLFGR